MIFNKISGAYTLSTIYIKNKGLTDREIALVGEHLSELPGVGIGTDWSRNYQMENQLKVLLVLFLQKRLVYQVITYNTI